MISQHVLSASVGEIVDTYDIKSIWGERAEAFTIDALKQAKAGIVLGLSGKIGSGKSAVARRLTQEGTKAHDKFGYDKVVSFADPVRDEVNGMIDALKGGRELPEFTHNVPVEKLGTMTGILEQAIKEDVNVSATSRNGHIRRAMQFWGTDVKRSQDPLYWVKKIAQGVLADALDGHKTIVDDVRFPNEAKMVSDLAGIVVRLEADENTRRQRLQERGDAVDFDEVNHEHPSEVSLDDFEGFRACINTDDMDMEAVGHEIDETLQGLVDGDNEE